MFLRAHIWEIGYFSIIGPEHTGHFVQSQGASFLWRTRAHQGDMWRRQQSFLPASKVSVFSKVSYPTEWLPHATRTIASVLAAERRTQPQKRSVCGRDEPQPVAHLSHKLQCARQSWKIMVSYGNKYPRHKNAATLFSHRWPRFCGGPEHTRARCGGDIKNYYQKMARSQKNALSVAGTTHSLSHT